MKPIGKRPKKEASIQGANSPRRTSYDEGSRSAAQNNITFSFERTPEFMWELNPEGRYTWVSYHFQNLLGYDPKEALGRKITTFMPPDEQIRVDNVIHQHLVAGLPLVGFQCKNLCKDGRELIVEFNGEPVLDAAGVVTCMRGLAREPAASSQRGQSIGFDGVSSRAVFDFVTEAIFIHDAETGQILDVNRGACVMFEMSRLEFLTKATIGDISLGEPPYTVKEAVELVRKAAAEGHQVFEWYARGTKRGLFWVEVDMSPAFLDGRKCVIAAIRDISPRKEAEEALRKSEEKYRDIFNRAAEAIFQSTVEGRFVTVNPAMAHMLGYDSPEDLTSSLSDLASQLYVNPQQRKEYIAFVDGQTTDEYRNMILHFRRKDGDTIWVSVNSRPVRGADGKVRLIEGIAENITERKRAEDALAESEERYWSALELSHDCISILRQEKIVYANQSFLDVFGYAGLDELLDLNSDTIVHPDDLERLRGYTRSRDLGESTPSHYEFRGVRKDGSVLHIEASLTPMLYHGELVLHAFLKDVTDKKRAEYALAQSEERFLRAIETSQDAIVIVKEGMVLHVNRPWLDMHGYASADEILYRGISSLIHPDDLDRILGYSRGRDAGSNEPTQYRLKALRKNGSSMNLEALVMPMLYHGEFVQYIFLRDVTEQERAEKALAESEARYRTIIENLSEAVLVVKGGHRFHVNRRWLEIFGYETVEEVLELPDWVTRHPDDRDRLKGYWDQARSAKTTPEPYDFRGLRKDGTTIYLEAAPSPAVMIDGEVTHFIFLRDVTERRLTERRIAQSEELFRTAIENSNDGVLIYQGNRQLYANRRWLEIFGYDRIEEIRDRTRELVHPDDYDRVWAITEDRARGLPAPDRYEFKALKKDGTPIFVETNLSPITYEGERAYFSFLRDITSRKEAEAELAATKDYLATIFDSVHDALLVHDIDGNILDVNETMLEMYGMTREEAVGHSTVDNYVPPEEQPSRATVHQALIESKRYSFECKARRPKDDSRFDVEVWISRLPLTDRQLMLGSVRDISVRKQATERLKESEERYRAVFTDSPAVMLLIDPETGAIHDANGAACSFYGYSFRDLTGMKMTDINIANPEEVRFEMQRANTQQRSYFNFRHRLASGEIRDVEVYSGPIVIKGRKMLFSVVHDDTERKRAERSLAESEQRYRTAIENSNDGAIIHKYGRYIYANQKWLEMHGYESYEEIARSPDWFRFVHPADIERIGSYIAAQKKGEQPPERHEVMGIRKDGSIIYLENSVSQILVDGEPASLVFMRDVSSQKQHERELLRAKEAAEAANQAKSEFLANMSHEIRTPMNAIVGLGRLALKANPPPALRDYLTKIDSSARILLEIINNILDLSKIEARKLVLASADFLLNDLLRAIADMFSFEAKRKYLDLVLHSEPDVPNELSGDLLRLSQVLTNLVANAIKFTDAGSVTLSVSLVSSLDHRALLRFSVMDTGIGMTADEQLRIFKPFTQVDSSTTRKFGGTGLGLVISQELVHLMGGEIGVESAPGVGTTFSFIVQLGVRDLAGPSVDEGIAHTSSYLESEEWEAGIDLAGARVLLVEDNEINMQVARELLESFGMIVETANGGRKALEMLSQGECFDAVLLDIQMPELDGYSVAKAVRRDLGLSALPLIALTAHVGDAERRSCAQAGMDDYVSKPIEPRDLMTALTRRIAPGGEHTNRTPAPDRPAAHYTVPNDLVGIDTATALKRLSGNETLFVRLLLNYCRDYKGIGPEIRAAFERGDIESARRIAHTLKGTSGNLSIGAVQKAAADLEAVLGKCDEATAEKAISALTEALSPILAHEDRLQDAMDDSVQVLQSPIDNQEEDLTKILAEFHRLLARRNLKARLLFSKLKRSIKAKGVEGQMKLCEDALTRLDFKAAREQAESIASLLKLPLA